MRKCRPIALEAALAGLTALLSLVCPAAGGSAAPDWEQDPGYRKAKLAPVGTGKDGFTLLPPEQTGIRFTNFLSEERALASQILPSGSGVAAGDVDGDGWCDLFFCGLKCGCHLYRNLGNWKFEDITELAGVACVSLDATGAALVDIDGDGDLDLIVNSLGGGTHVFLNDGKGRFTETKQVLNPGEGGMSLALGDFDGESSGAAHQPQTGSFAGRAPREEFDQAMIHFSSRTSSVLALWAEIH